VGNTLRGLPDNVLAVRVGVLYLGGAMSAARFYFGFTYWAAFERNQGAPVRA
jgi:hypothetical protein